MHSETVIKCLPIKNCSSISAVTHAGHLADGLIKWASKCHVGSLTSEWHHWKDSHKMPQQQTEQTREQNYLIKYNKKSVSAHKIYTQYYF
jgi:hypothetical protein